MTIHPRTFQNFICLLSKVSSNSVNVGRIGGGGAGAGADCYRDGLGLEEMGHMWGQLKEGKGRGRIRGWESRVGGGGVGGRPGA